jgi:hypothetical protein
MKKLKEELDDRRRVEMLEHSREMAFRRRFVDEAVACDRPGVQRPGETQRIEDAKRDIRDMVIQRYKSTKPVKVGCDECGFRLVIDTEYALASSPPQYKVWCLACGWTSSVRCAIGVDLEAKWSEVARGSFE